MSIKFLRIDLCLSYNVNHKTFCVCFFNMIYMKVSVSVSVSLYLSLCLSAVSLSVFRSVSLCLYLCLSTTLSQYQFLIKGFNFLLIASPNRQGNRTNKFNSRIKYNKIDQRKKSTERR